MQRFQRPPPMDYDGTLLSSFPYGVFLDLCAKLNVKGPCSWKALTQVLQKQGYFSDNEVRELYKSSLGAEFILEQMINEQQTIGFLLYYLNLLPCQCASNALIRSLEKFYDLPLDAVSSLTHSHRPDFNEQAVIEIVEQPRDQHLSGEETGMLRFVIKTNFTDITYQWYHNDKPIANATEWCYFIQDLSFENIGHYFCIASSSALGHRPEGSVRSQDVYVDIVCPVSQHVSEFNASDKVALLIGNDIYLHNQALPAVSRDLRILTKIFKEELFYKTLSFQNLNFNDMHRVLSQFIDLTLKGCYCVFYFGGHGYENDGLCYLVPTDAPENFRCTDCLQAQRELEDIQRRCKPNMMLILLDICRKRNPNDFPPSFSSTPRFLDNVVFAYATTENRAAYEQNGGTFGIFVNSLRLHLKKPARVNHMLSPVQDDVSKSTVQFMEVKSLLSTNRCLTDRLEQGEDYAEKHREWKSVHDVPDLPILIECEETGLSFEISFRSVLTNCVQVEAIPCLEGCSVVIIAERLKMQQLAVYDKNGFLIPSADNTAHSCVQISGFQNLKANEIKISFRLRRQESQEIAFEKIYTFPFEPPWKLQRCRVGNS